jgi:S-DNA-T family DNA segregation ATPase FtsK/SpoIIIE
MAKKKLPGPDIQNMFAQQMMNMMAPFTGQFPPPQFPQQPFGGMPQFGVPGQFGVPPQPGAMPAPAQLFYAVIDGRQAGPFPLAEIARLVNAGSIGKDTLIWRQGLTAWQVAASLPEIAGIFPPAGPPPSAQIPQQAAPPPAARPVYDAPLPPAAAASFPQGTMPQGAAPVPKRPQKSWEGYALPMDGILNETRGGAETENAESEAEEKAAILESVLAEFKIEARVTGIQKGPVVTMFEILPAPGIKLSKITGLEDNIALRLAAHSMRIVAPIPGKEAVGIEVPNKKRAIVGFREIIEAGLAVEDEKTLPLFLGKDISGGLLSADLAAMPHLLVAGATGSGKSVCVNTIILSLVYRFSPAACRMIFIDPKIVELKIYNNIPHLLIPVITEPPRALQALQYCVREMERRYGLLEKLSVRSIKTYNKAAGERGAETLPYLVVIIDEFADLMAVSGKELEGAIVRLAAMSRAVGIHLVLATQRPSADVITGLIKSNIPTRIAFMVASMMDSRIIIDTPGAEKLLGKGDMLYCGADSPFPVRAQGAFVSEEEAEKTAAYLKSLGEPEYIDM